MCELYCQPNALYAAPYAEHFAGVDEAQSTEARPTIRRVFLVSGQTAEAKRLSKRKGVLVIHGHDAKSHFFRERRRGDRTLQRIV
jgi:hypothetical protein